LLASVLMFAVELRVSVAVVESALLKSFICADPVDRPLIICHSTLIHWFSEIEFVVVPRVVPAWSRMLIVPLEFSERAQARLAPLILRTSWKTFPGFAVKYRYMRP